jgi:hypothetical protein
MSNERRDSSSDGKKKKKRPYIPPTIIKRPLEKAKQLIMERTHCSDKEAMDLLIPCAAGNDRSSNL